MSIIDSFDKNESRKEQLDDLNRFISKLYSAKYHRERPFYLEELEEAASQENNEFKMGVRYGKNKLSENGPLFIRRVDSSLENIKSLAFNELRCLKRLESMSLVAKTHCYFVELSSCVGLFSYVFVFEGIGCKLKDFKGTDETNLLIARNLVNAYGELNAKGVYHGNLNFDSILVCDSCKIQFSNFILGGLASEFEYDSTLQKQLFFFADPKFCSPEVKLAISAYENDSDGCEFSPIQSDIFSLGLVLLRFFSDFSSLNQLNIDAELLPCIKLSSYEEIERSLLIREKNPDIVISLISQLQEKISQAVSCAPLEFQPLLLKFLRVYYNGRFLRVAQEERKEKIILCDFRWYQTMQENDQNSLIANEIIVQVFEFFDKISSPNYKIELHLSEFFEELQKIYADNELQLRGLLLTYEKQKIRSTIKMTYGIAMPLIYIFLKFKSQNHFKKFLQLAQKHKANYIKLIGYYLQHTDEEAKDYILTSVLNAKLYNKKELEFVFPASGWPDLSYKSLDKFNEICELFQSLLNCSFVVNALRECSGQSHDFQEEFQKLAPFCFLFNMKPRLCGSLSMNLRIFIKDYFYIVSCRENISYEEATTLPQPKAAILIVLLHEYCHYLRRLNIKRRSEYHQNKTPVSSEFPETNLKRKGESGFQLEQKLFGSRVTFLSVEAALTLINHEEPTLEEFKANFTIKNICGEDQLEMRGDGENLKIGCCELPYFDVDDFPSESTALA